MFLCLLVPYAAFVALIVGTPLMRLTQEASALNALLLSGGFALAIAVLWRLWPAFGLSFLWDDAYPESDGGSWILDDRSYDAGRRREAVCRARPPHTQRESERRKTKGF